MDFEYRSFGFRRSKPAASRATITDLPDELILQICGTLKADREATYSRPPVVVNLPHVFWDPIAQRQRFSDRALIEVREPHVLTIVMRVSKRFHDLAAPLIYTRAKVKDPAQLFYGISEPSPSGRLSKIDKLAFVERLDLVFPGREASFDPMFTGCHFLTTLSPHAREFLPSYLVTLANAQEASATIAECLEAAPGTRRKALLPNLHQLHLGPLHSSSYQEDHPAWGMQGIPSHLQESVPPNTVFGDLMENRHFIARTFAAHLQRIAFPLHVCDHNGLGPLSYDVAVPIGGRHVERPITYTTAVGSWNRKYGTPVPIMLGGTTRLIVNDQVLTQYLSRDVWHGVGPGDHHEQSLSLGKYLHYFRDSLAITIRQLNRTNIKATRSRVVVYLPGNMRVLRMTLRHIRPGQPSPIELEDEQVHRGIMHYLRGKGAWSGIKENINLQVRLTDKSGDCPGCGERWKARTWH